MAYALRTSAGPIELDPSQPVRIGEGDEAITYVVPWVGNDLPALGILPIEEPGPVPDGKMVTGQSLSDDGALIRRVWTLADAPAAPVVAPVPVMLANAEVEIADGDIAGVNVAVGSPLALYNGPGDYTVYFDATQPDTAYSVLPVSSSPDFRVGYTKSPEGISFCAVDASGQPADPPSFSFQATATRT